MSWLKKKRFVWTNFNFNISFLIYLFLFSIQRSVSSVQLEAIHFLELSRGDPHLQYRYSGEVRQREETQTATQARRLWRICQQQIGARSRMGLREAERIFEVISRSYAETFRLSIRHTGRWPSGSQRHFSGKLIGPVCKYAFFEKRVRPRKFRHGTFRRW